MKNLFSFFLLLNLLYSVAAYATDATRRDFLLGFAATAVVAPTLLTSPAVTAQPTLPPIPPGYFEKRFGPFLNGQTKQAEKFNHFNADQDLGSYLYSKRDHDDAMKKKTQTPTPAPIAEYDAIIKAHAKTLMKIEQRIAMEFNVSLEHVAEEINRMYFNQVDAKDSYFNSARRLESIKNGTDSFNFFTRHFQQERPFTPLGIEARDRYIELLSESNPQEAYELLFEELFFRYYTKDSLYFQPELPAGFPRRETIWHDFQLHHFLVTKNPRYLRVDTRTIKDRYEYEVSPAENTNPPPRIVSLIDKVKKRLPYKLDLNTNSLTSTIMDYKNVRSAKEPNQEAPTATTRFKYLQMPRLINALIATRNLTSRYVMARLQANATNEMAIENPSRCPQLLISHQPEVPMAPVEINEADKVEVNKAQ